jgi:alkylation response protein AidB-like acyl-CoA dehydrogenase
VRAALGDTQEALLQLARSVATDLGVTTVEHLPPAGDADRAWQALADSGLLTLRADGAGTLELVVCAEELGAALSPAPFVGAAVARELWPEAPGRAVAALDEGLAPDAWGATHVVTVVDGAVHAGPAQALGPTADRSRVAARTSAPAIVGSERSPSATSGDPARAEAVAMLLLAADLVGTGRAALADAVAHVTERHQFGVPVGTFQAVQHMAADAHVQLVAARNLLRAAAWRLDHLGPGALPSVRRAKAVASEAGRAACETACQMFGGLGHTWEHLASVRLRRALVSRAVLGDEHRQWLALAGAAPATTPAGTADADGYDLRDDDVEAGFRQELRRWLASPEGGPGPDWARRLVSAGWVAVSMPTDAGGRALPVTCEAIVSEELGAADRPPPPAIGHLAHALAEFGSPAQRADHLAGMLSGESRWCQGFSEPEAGSDLASIRTRAELVDGEWVIDGRKIWTSDAAWADWILLLCRTGGPGHRGLSVLLVPTTAPGVGISPIRTAWGSDEFAEVVLDGVRVPADAVVGEPGQGWPIAMSLLAVERGPADIGWIARFRRAATRLLADPTAGRTTGAVRSTAWLEALDATVAATLTARSRGTHDTAAGSVDKLLMTRVDQWLHAAVLDAGGVAQLERPGAELELYLWARAASVFGGTSQIQRNIIAQRLLGLPRS